MDPYGSPRVLWRMAQIPLLLGLFDTTVLDEAAIIIVIKGVQRLLHRGIGQEHGFAPPGPSSFPCHAADDHRMARVGLEVAAVVLAPVFR
jgi:hypothetical protein